MTYSEALEWLKGNRSNINSILNTTDDRPHEFAMITQADAGSVQEAYWIVRAHREGIVDDET